MKKYVQEYISPLPAFVKPEDSLQAAVLKMEKFNFRKILVCGANLKVAGTLSKRDIADFLLSKRLREEINAEFLEQFSVKDVLNKETTGVVAYPKCEIEEIIEIMGAIKTRLLPVLSSPWNKKLEGFIRLEDILIKTM